MRLCLPNDQKASPVLNGFFVPLALVLFVPPSCLPSNISQSWQTWVKLCHHTFASLLLQILPSLLLYSVLVSSETRVNLLALEVCWLNPGDNLLYTNGMWVTTVFSHWWMETSIFFPIWELITALQLKKKKMSTSSFPTMTKNHS